jgi:FixJ family two-component response regulator
VGAVLVDLAMPGTSGEELIDRLAERQSPLAPVVISGVADVKTTVRVMQRGAVTVLEKPFSESELLAALEAALARSQSHGTQRAEVAAIAAKLNALDADDQLILERMIAGSPIKSCSAELHLSTRTIERRRKALLELLGAQSIGELAVLVEKARSAHAWKPQGHLD